MQRPWAEYPIAVGAQPSTSPFAPPSARVTLKPFPMDLYFSLSTWSLHFTRSRGVTAVWVMPQERTPPKAQRAKYFWLPNSQLYSSVAAATKSLWPTCNWCYYLRYCHPTDTSVWHSAPFTGLAKSDPSFETSILFPSFFSEIQRLRGR